MWGLAVSATVFGGIAALNILQRVGFDFDLIFNPCGFRVRTGYPCISCGMTRAVLAFSRGDLIYAFNMQPAAWLLCWIVVGIGIAGLYIGALGKLPAWVRRFCAEIKVKHILWSLLVIFLAGWAVTVAKAFAMHR
ncbi:DUF2752 domain-containing protein [Planctomycetota bacterium]